MVLVSSLVCLLMKDQRARSCPTYSTPRSKSGPTRPCMTLARPASARCTLLNRGQVFTFPSKHATIWKNLSLSSSSSLSLGQHLLILILVDHACILCRHIYGLLHLRPVNDVLLLDWELLLIGQIDLLILDLDATLPVVEVLQRVGAMVLRLLKVEYVFVVWVQVEWRLLVRITAAPWNLLKRYLRRVLTASVEIVCSFLVCTICLVSSGLWMILGNQSCCHQLHIGRIRHRVSMNHSSGSSSSSNLLEDLSLIKLALEILRSVHRVASGCWLRSIDAILIEELIVHHLILDLIQLPHIGNPIVCYQLRACEISTGWIDVHSLILVHNMIHWVHPMILVMAHGRVLASIVFVTIFATARASHHFEGLSFILIQNSFLSSTVVELASLHLVLGLGLVLQDLLPWKVNLILLDDPVRMASSTLSCSLSTLCSIQILHLFWFGILILPSLTNDVLYTSSKGDLLLRVHLFPTIIVAHCVIAAIMKELVVLVVFAWFGVVLAVEHLSVNVRRLLRLLGFLGLLVGLWSELMSALWWYGWSHEAHQRLVWGGIKELLVVGELLCAC